MPAYKKIDATSVIGKRTIEGLLRLREGLDRSVKEGGIPRKTVDPTLLLATWNIREFGKYANTGNHKDAGRDQEALFYLAEIISRFDIVAIQEVQGNLDGLDELIGILGNWWKYLVSDSSLGTTGGSERHAYIYDTRKVVFGGMAGEVVPEPEKVKVPLLDKNGQPVLDKKGRPKEAVYLKSFTFARTPYIAGFRAGWFKFTICTQHFNYGEGENDPQRVAEATQIARILSNRVSKTSEESWAHNTILLGDFNVFDIKTDETFVAIENMKFNIPPQLRGTYTNAEKDKPFDQIAFLSCDEVWQMEQLQAGTFPFFNYVYRESEEDCARYDVGDMSYYKKWRTYKMSDHLPLWVELHVDFGDEYLNAKRADAAKELGDDYREPVG
jgi:endonuclease/exonuclease/phosphatase family metal-dependent hydrolase